MLTIRRSVLWGALALGAACGDGPTAPISADYTFGADGWTSGFADYRPSEAGPMQLVSRIEPVPPPVGRDGHLMGGTNYSDDLFMFLTRRIQTPRESTTFTADFVVEFATDVPSGCGGIGGSPSESVWVKAGGSPTQPVATVDEAGTLRMSVDIGNQAIGGANAAVLGTIGNSITCEMSVRRWELKTLSGSLPVTSDANGRLWIFVGSDSGFEGRTEIYLTQVMLGLSTTH